MEAPAAFLRPSSSSHTSRNPSISNPNLHWTTQYNRDAQSDQTRRLASASAMHTAVKTASPSQLQSLLQSNPDPDARDAKGRTPLHTAAKFGRTAQLDLLLDRKDVDIDAVDLRKETPLHLAAMFDRYGCVERLMRAGANTGVVDERGHLPRWYARGEVRGLFDNPPRVDRNVRGSGGKGKKVDEGQPEGRVLEEVEIVYLATEATAPQGMQKVLCEAFGGSFWEPQGERKWTSGSVWELVYGGVEKAGRKRAAGSKWFHLSATSEVWAKDLARNICAARGCSTEKSRAMRDFVGRVFKGVDAEGPVRKRHFVREKASERKLADDEMYAVVLPIIDVDKRDYVQLARNHRTMVLNQARETGTLSLNTLNVVPVDPVLGVHLARMMQLSSLFDQPIPRSLDQSYHEYLDDVKIGILDSDQVMTRYIVRLKAKGVEAVRKPAEKRFSVFGMTSSASVVRPIFPIPSPEESPAPSVQVHEGSQADDQRQDVRIPLSEPLEGDSDAHEMRHEDSHDVEPDDLITVPHFWLFKLDADTVITLYPERWDITNEARLHDHVLNSVSNNRDLQGDPDAFSANALVETILKSCLSFEAKAFAKCINPDMPDDSHDVEVTFSKAYSNSIAEIYTEATERFDSLKNGLGSLSKDPNAFYRDVKEETKILIRIDDNIGEIRMIKRILLNQAATFDIFWRAVLGGDDSDRGAAGSRCGFQLENVETFEQLETEAERVRSMAVTLLDLRQREASIEDALSMGEQSTMLFIFTTVTVLFAPLSFVCGLLAMPITGFPDIWSAFPLAEVFGLATLGTVGLCLLMWALYKVYQTMEIAQRNKERQPQAPPQPATVLTRTGDHAGPGTYIWRIPGPWRRGDPLRFRKSRVKQYDNALESVKAAAVGTVRDDSSGHRRSDVEKGAVGVSG